MKRIAQVIRIKPGMEQRYLELHAACWPGVLEQIHKSNIRNYSIFLRDGMLFAYYEYVGSNFSADMQKMAEDPTTQAWLKETMPCQEPVDHAEENIWWADLAEVFHTD